MRYLLAAAVGLALFLSGCTMILGLDGYSFEDKCLQPLDGEVRVHTCPDAGDGGK